MLVTATEAARRLGLNQSTVSRQIVAWEIPRESDGRFEFEAYASKRQGDLQVAKRSDYSAAKAGHEDIRRQLAEMELAERRGELLRREDVAADGTETAQQLKSALLALPDRLGSELELTPAQVDGLIEALEGVLEELSKATGNGGMAGELQGGDRA